MMSFDPVKPEVHHAPLKIADDTWLIQQMQEAIIGVFIYLTQDDVGASMGGCGNSWLRLRLLWLRAWCSK